MPVSFIVKVKNSSNVSPGHSVSFHWRPSSQQISMSDLLSPSGLQAWFVVCTW